MKISKVRTYLSNQVKTIDSDFYEWEDAFNIDNIPSNIKDKSYHIAYEIPTSADFDTHLEDAIDVTVSVFFKGYRTPAATLDTAMDLCNDIRIQAVKKESIEAFRSTDDNPIFGVISNSIVPTTIPSNDNQVVITLQFTIRMAQTIC